MIDDPDAGAKAIKQYERAYTRTPPGTVWIGMAECKDGACQKGPDDHTHGLLVDRALLLAAASEQREGEKR